MDFCADRGGAEDAEEDAWVFDTFGSYGGANRNLWIGLNEIATEGTYVLSSGSTATYRNWNPGQTDNNPNSPTGEDNVQIVVPVTGYTPGRWNDAPDSTNLSFAGDVYGVVESRRLGRGPSPAEGLSPMSPWNDERGGRVKISPWPSTSIPFASTRRSKDGRRGAT